MRIEHLAIWTHKIEEMKQFYETRFNAVSSEKYVNHSKNFSSYFLTFDSGSRLELMHKPGLQLNKTNDDTAGLAHFAISVGSKEKVNRLTEQLRNEGVSIVGEPRHTGDGYYESIILDPDQNRVELTI